MDYKRCRSKYKNNGKHIITSSIEHYSIIHKVNYLPNKGFVITFLPVDKYGFIKIENLKKIISKDTILVRVVLANNEIGIIEPKQKIGEYVMKIILFFTQMLYKSMGIFMSM